MIQAFELRPFIVKIVFDLEINSKAGKEFTNKKKKKFGVGLTGSGLGNASGKSYRVDGKFYICRKSVSFVL